MHLAHSQHAHKAHPTQYVKPEECTYIEGLMTRRLAHTERDDGRTVSSTLACQQPLWLQKIGYLCEGEQMTRWRDWAIRACLSATPGNAPGNAPGDTRLRGRSGGAGATHPSTVDNQRSSLGSRTSLRPVASGSESNTMTPGVVVDGSLITSASVRDVLALRCSLPAPELPSPLPLCWR